MPSRWLPMAFALALTSAPSVAREPFEAKYELFFGGLRAADITLSVEWDGETYVAESTIRARGLAAALLSTDARAMAHGNGGSRPQPAGFRAEGRFGRTQQVVEMTYGGPSPLPMHAEPPLRERPRDPTPESLVGALDPLSAAVAALTPRPPEAACDTVIPIFDSRRRYDLEVGPPQREANGRLRCDGRFVRVAGFRDLSAGDFDDFRLTWRVDNGLATLERAEVPTSWGTAVARRAR